MNFTANKRPFFLTILVLSVFSLSGCFRDQVNLICQLEAFLAGDPLVFEECSSAFFSGQRSITFFTEGEGGIDIIGFDLNEGISQEIGPDGISSSLSMGNEFYFAQSGSVTFDKVDEEQNLLSGEASFIMVSDSNSAEFSVEFENVVFQ